MKTNLIEMLKQIYIGIQIDIIHEQYNLFELN